jgi:O-methyltransferase involved in polyketide biosynthesis
LGAAAHRAAHQVLEQGNIFTDPLALRIMGQHAKAAVRDAEQNPSRRGFRIFIAIQKLKISGRAR